MGLHGKKGGNMVLGNRHVIGVFLLMVVISGIVFTLGYVLGRSQYDPQARLGAKEAGRAASGELAAAKPAAASAKTPPAEATPAPSSWDFYRAAEPKKSQEWKKAEKLVSGASKPAAQTKPSAKLAAAKANALLNAPLIPRGAILLQVAALTREGDALALAEALQQKKFPAFVLTPGADHYYRVQVGPYADGQSANVAKRALENEGFKSIIKR